MNNAMQIPPHPHQILPKALVNGEMQHLQPNGGGHIVTAKKIQPPFHDPRNDLMKAIRDGKQRNKRLSYNSFITNFLFSFSRHQFA